MPSPPAEITVATILSAKGDELRFWIENANADARAHRGFSKNPLTKTGRVDELRHRLATFYGLDLLAVKSEDVEAPGTSIDEEIQQRQWAHMRSLAQEWERKAGMSVPFILCNHSLSREFTQAESPNNWCLYENLTRI